MIRILIIGVVSSLGECGSRAGLTRQELAATVGRQGRGGHHVVSRLERGEVPNPAVGLVADYLRACGAGFSDILSVLDEYTIQPTAQMSTFAER